MLAIYRKELQTYFYSPLGYVFMGSFLFVAGIFFAFGNIMSVSADFGTMLSNVSFIFMLVVPILTMKLMSDERRTKTDQLLLTSPVSLWSVVVGKFLAACTVFLFTLVLTFVYVIILAAFGNISLGEVFVNYLGFFLTGCCMIAVGLFVSTLTESQVTASIATFGVILMLYLMDSMVSLITADYLQFLVTGMKWLSLFSRFSDFTSGILNISSTIYMITFAFVFLFLTVCTTEKRRWSEG